MTAEEAVAQAEAEGLTLLRSGTVSGFKNVTFNNGRVKPYQARVYHGGETVFLSPELDSIYLENLIEAAQNRARTRGSKVVTPRDVNDAAATVAGSRPKAGDSRRRRRLQRNCLNITRT